MVNEMDPPYLVLVKNNIKHLRWTLRQLLSGNHLHVKITTLRLAPGLY